MIKIHFSKVIVVAAALLAAAPAAMADNPKNPKKAKTEKAPMPQRDAKADSLPLAVLRIDQVIDLVNKEYVETPDLDKCADKAIATMLQTLDPHCVYIPAKDVERANEGLQGNFEGVGIAFQIVKDTINIQEVIVGGPSEKVGLQVGDKIVRIDGLPAVGDSVTNTFVQKHLRGKKGTKVTIDVLRHGQPSPLSFTITRDKVPIYSVDSYFMANDTVGYIRLTRFALTSDNEFRKAVTELKKQGMKAMIFDLRGNTGGYLDIAYALADEFLPQRQLIVYTQGRNQPRKNFISRNGGCFETGRVVVLIDENSASASEIVSGALQDWDRATIIGRRSFGKGLVQRMFTLADGAQVRLTTARYYTPSGRCIQKPYDNGIEAYQNDIAQRYLNHEMSNIDSIHFPDSLKFRTHAGRIVYGGGGIMPDVFVPMDTLRLSDFYLNVRSQGLLNTFPLSWADAHREDTLCRDFESFMANYDRFGIDSLFALKAQAEGVKSSDVKGEWVASWIADQMKKEIKDTISPIHAQSYAEYLEQIKQQSDFNTALSEKAAKEDARAQLVNSHSEAYLHAMLQALVAKDLFGQKYYYLVIKDIDEGYKEAMRQITK